MCLFPLTTHRVVLICNLTTKFTLALTAIAPSFYLDPLEQFDVLSLPVIGGGLTNLSLLLGLNLLIMVA